MDMEMEIAKRLATLRRAHGLSQEELAARLGVSRQAVSKWERAESSPDTANLIALARLYAISLDELLLLGPVRQPRSDEAEASCQPGGAEDEASRQEAEIFAAARAWDEAEEAYEKQRRKRLERQREKLLLPLTLFLMVALPLICLLLDLGNNTYAVGVTIVYLITGFALDNWHPGWMLYLTIPVYYGLAERLM